MQKSMFQRFGFLNTARDEKYFVHMERKIYKFDDSVIAQIVRVIQLGFLTGTDVSDHMRQFRLEEGKDGTLSLTPEYVEHDQKAIDTLFDDLEGLMAQEKKEQN